MGNLTIVNKSNIDIIVKGLTTVYGRNEYGTVTIGPGNSKQATYSPIPDKYDLSFSIPSDAPLRILGIFAGENDPYPISRNNEYVTFSKNILKIILDGGTYYIKNFNPKKYIFNSKLTFTIYISTKVDNEEHNAILASGKSILFDISSDTLDFIIYYPFNALKIETDTSTITENNVNMIIPIKNLTPITLKYNSYNISKV